MITVRITGYGISASGHAGMAPRGSDIVCAAFTILMETFAACVERMKAEGKLHDSVITLGEGKAEVSALASQDSVDEYENIYRTIVTGIELLAGMYPECFEIKKYLWHG